MKRFIIKKKAWRFRKSLKGNIDVFNITNYLIKLGYNIVFFNTLEGDELLKTYGLSDVAANTKAFTYSGTLKLVFVDNNLTSEDKLYFMLHEVGHILLNHLDDSIQYKNKYLLDIDANEFVFEVLYYKRQHWLLYAVMLTVFIAFSTYFFCVSHPQSNVCITASGKAYHRESCMSIKGHKYISIPQEEAAKIYTACKICNP